MAGKIPFKKEKFAHRILNEINQILRSGANDKRVQFVSITKVELSPDNQMAKVYWDTFDPSIRGDVKKALAGMAGRIRTELGKVLQIRHVPELEFLYDGQFESEQAIEALLASEAKEGRGSGDE